MNNKYINYYNELDNNNTFNNNNNDYNINSNNYNINLYNNNFNNNDNNNKNNNYNNNNNYNINLNNYNYNNNDNIFINNNYNNNNYNNNNDPFPIPNNNANSEPKSSNEYIIKSANVPSNNIKFEDDKICCFYKHEILTDYSSSHIIIIIILCSFHIVLTTIQIYFTLDYTIFLIFNFVQLFYAFLCLLTIVNNKCIRYFGCVFNFIFLFVGEALVILEMVNYNNHQDDIDKDTIDYRIILDIIRWLILLFLTFFMNKIFCKTYCLEHCNNTKNMSYYGNNNNLFYNNFRRY